MAVQEIQTGRLQLSNSQLSRIRLKVRQNRKDLNPFAIYLKGTKDRKSADDQFRKSRLTVKRQTLNFREWLINLAENPTSVWQEMDLQKHGWQKNGNQWQRPLLGKKAYVLTDELAVMYTIRLVDAVCNQAQKGGK